MRYHDSVFGKLIKPLSRRQFDAIVERHAGNAYDKSFQSWDHLVALIFAQLSGVDGLRGLEAVWNANAHHHYHLGSKTLKRRYPLGCQCQAAGSDLRRSLRTAFRSRRELPEARRQRGVADH